MFRIRLHVDDINVLRTIQAFLGAGRVTVDGDSALFTISDLKEILNVLIPFCEKQKLFTTKWLDFLDFRLAAGFLSS